MPENLFSHIVRLSIRRPIMLRKILTISIVSVIVLAFAAPVHAGVTVGPFAGTSPDSGTCGPDWAQDSFQRLFTDVTPTGAVEWFNNGTFVTIGGKSPGACNSGTDNGNTVAAGVPGTFSGVFDISVSGATQFTPGACSQATCDTTAKFVHTVYGAGATYNTGAGYFAFNYRKNCTTQTWRNASANRGGNAGDITGDPVNCPAPPQWYNPGDNRVNPQAAERLVVWCNNPDQIVVYGVNNEAEGFLLTTFSNREVLAAGKKGVFHNLGKMGVVSINEEAPTYFWLAWNGGPYGAYGRDVWAKAFRCQFSAQ